MSESVFEAVCKEVRKDLEAGFYFPQEHVISQAARNGKLDGADVVRKKNIYRIVSYLNLCDVYVYFNSIISIFNVIAYIIFFRLLVFGCLKTLVISINHV